MVPANARSPLDLLEAADQAYDAGNQRQSAQLLWQATEAAFVHIAEAHHLDPTDLIAVARALDAHGRPDGYHYAGHLITGWAFRDHAVMDIIEPYEMDEMRAALKLFIHRNYNGQAQL